MTKIRVGLGKGEVGRLMLAHEALVRAQPGRNASVAVWVAFHEASARVYAEIAEVDRGHHHEALYWAGRQREIAKTIRDTGVVPTHCEIAFAN